MLTNQLTVLYVCAYSVDRLYGGPEEGGWWYDWNDYVGIEAVIVSADGDDEAAYAKARELNEAEQADEADRGHRSRFSVIGHPDLRYFVDEVPGESQSTEREHYC